ncbi:siderophore-interacting protein [Novosphingobium guangzhouense]|uniref:NADPH-dependent ferric siderophore reductase n=1 Tax=Novosphingobium guangzhouense TaxID=1850347 RepID=A0A2K2FTS4_9SPHN|nr:siderophore-interacting protein [Novosphingobium guangzhouense]PNU02197.1 NADPH-dependent ferric siderophore reductase [Novosphingobium guangzhouense]
MTESTTAPVSPASRPSSALRGEDHDKGLHDVLAVVETIERPGFSVQRIGVRLQGSTQDPNWCVPNVAFRLHFRHEGEEISRIYTVRDSDGAGRFRFDVVLHEGTSPMMQWVAGVKVGDSFALTGPRPHMSLPETGGRKMALFLDETAIPALYSLLQRWPDGVTGEGWVVTRDPVAFAELPRIDGLHLAHLYPVEGEDMLLRYARELPDAPDRVVWAAGERREMRAIRQHFTTLGVSKKDVAITGYWGRGLSNTQIDERRKADYEAVLARGGTLSDYDDLAVEV